MLFSEERSCKDQPYGFSVCIVHLVDTSLHFHPIGHGEVNALSVSYTALVTPFTHLHTHTMNHIAKFFPVNLTSWVFPLTAEEDIKVGVSLGV